MIHVPAAYILQFWNYWFYKDFISLYLCLRPRFCSHEIIGSEKFIWLYMCLRLRFLILNELCVVLVNSKNDLLTLWGAKYILKSCFDYICACNLDFRDLKVLVLQRFCWLYLCLRSLYQYLCLRPRCWSHELIGSEDLLFDYFCACGLDFIVLNLLVLKNCYLIISVPTA